MLNGRTHRTHWTRAGGGEAVCCGLVAVEAGRRRTRGRSGDERGRTGGCDGAAVPVARREEARIGRDVAACRPLRLSVAVWPRRGPWVAAVAVCIALGLMHAAGGGLGAGARGVRARSVVAAGLLPSISSICHPIPE